MARTRLPFVRVTDAFGAIAPSSVDIGAFERPGLYGEMDRATRKPVELARTPDSVWLRLADRKSKE